MTRNFMVCPACPAISIVGGYIGGYFGISAPEQTELRIASAVITAGIVCITAIATKCIFGISFCDGNGDFSLRNIAQVGAISLFLGIICSVVVNCLLNLFFSEPGENETPPVSPQPEVLQPSAPCCHNS